MEKTYNGWKNYETWLAALWIDNDGSSDYWRDRAAELLKKNDTREVIAIIADELKEGFNGESYRLTEQFNGSGFWVDLIDGALAQINWREIAEHFLES